MHIAAQHRGSMSGCCIMLESLLTSCFRGTAGSASRSLLLLASCVVATLLNHNASLSDIVWYLHIGGSHVAPNAPDLSFCGGTKQQVDTIRQRCAFSTDRDDADDTICIPAAFAGHHFEKGFGMPGSLKSSKYLLLAGPLGKYLLEGCMHAEVSAHKVTQQWSSAESVRQHGPCWAWSMFGFERLWCRLHKWMTQPSLLKPP